MLNHHPEIAVPLESIFLVDYLKASGRVEIEKQKKFLKREPMLKEWEIELTEDDLDEIKDTKDIVEVVHRVYARKHGKLIWGNKTPRMTRYTGLVKKHLGEVRFIHMIRDPRAVASSITKSNIHRSNVYYGAKRWTRYIEAGLELEGKCGDDVLRVYYEKLVGNPEGELKKICRFLGVKYSEEMFGYRETGNREYRNYHSGAHEALTGKPDPKKAGAWKKELGKGEVKVVEHICKGWMEKVGYAPLHEDTSLSMIVKSKYRVHRGFGFSCQILRYIRLCPWYLAYTFYRKVSFGTIAEEVMGVSY